MATSCHLLKASGLSRSTYNYHMRKKPDRYAAERRLIKALHAERKGRYGYVRICSQLRNECYTINHKTVYGIMKEEGLKNVRKRCKYRSYKGDVGVTAPNLLHRDFAATEPNRKWATDVT